jgi:membrane protease YdiL (CAAX protease family)
VKSGLILSTLTAFGLFGYLALAQQGAVLASALASLIGLIVTIPTFVILFERPSQTSFVVTPLQWLCCIIALQTAYLFAVPSIPGSENTATILLSICLLTAFPLAASYIVPYSILWSCIIIAVIWIPFDHRVTSEFWPWPSQQLGYPFASFFASSLALITFTKLRRQRALCVDLPVRFSLRNLFQAVLGFVLLAAILLPIAFATDFITTVSLPIWYRPAILFIAVFFTIALPEELIFRGILQNLFIQKLGPAAAIGLSAILFGLTHWNNGIIFWDWRYLVLASLAGIGYGLAYHLTGRLMVAVVIHALVDTIWVSFFK